MFAAFEAQSDGTEPMLKRLTLTLLALALALLCPATAAGLEELELELGLFNRFTLRRNHVERMLRYSEPAAAFDGRSYLAPRVDQLYYSFLVRAGLYLEPTRWLGVGLTVDSGEVVPTGQLPAEGRVPLSSGLSAVLEDPPVLTTEDRRRVTASGQPIGDEARSTFFIRQAFVRLAAPQTAWLTLRAGRIATEAATNLVYDDFGLGARLEADLERLRDWPIRVTAQALLPTRSWERGLRSPLVELRLDYVFSTLLTMVESVGLTVAYFHDGDGNFGQLFHPYLSEAAVRTQPTMDPADHRDLFGVALATTMPSRGDVAWIGLDGSKLLGDLLISGTVLLELGHVSLDNPFFQLVRMLPPEKLPRVPRDQTIELDTLGVAADLSLRYQITESISFGGFGLYLSGEQNPFMADGDLAGRFNSFLGVVPYLTRTNLFFSGGMNETFSGRQVSTAGINGRGVGAAGATFSWDITRAASCGSRTTVLFSPVPSMSGGQLYGVEVDIEGSYQLLDYLKLSMEYDVMVMGSFFPTRGTAHKLLVGLDLTYQL